MSDIYIIMLNIIELLTQLNMTKLNYSADLSIYRLRTDTSSDDGKEPDEPELPKQYYEIQNQAFRKILELITNYTEFTDSTIESITQYLTELSGTLDVTNYKPQKPDSTLGIKFQKAIDAVQSMGNSRLRDLLIDYKTRAYN